MNDIDPLSFLSFDDLVRLGIVRSRVDLFRMQRHANFPQALKYNGVMQAKAYYRRSDVEAWVLANLKPVRQSQPAQ